MNLALFFTFLALTCTASIAIPLTELSNKDATIFNHAQVYKFLQDSLKNSKGEYSLHRVFLVIFQSILNF